MPKKGYRGTTLPKEVVDEIEEFLRLHRDRLKKMGIKKISHVLERAWYVYKDHLESRW